MKPQFTLGDMIAALERIERKKTPVRFDFAGLKPKDLDSYRGFYAHLALGWEESEKDMSVKALLEMCRKAVGKTFQGYKGGGYTMSLSTPLWVANYGECHGTAVVGVADGEYQVVIETECKD